jgi:hypothetical protein
MLNPRCLHPRHQRSVMKPRGSIIVGTRIKRIFKRGFPLIFFFIRADPCCLHLRHQRSFLKPWGSVLRTLGSIFKERG